MIDSDLNNSLSYHYLDESMMERTRKLNFAQALSDEPAYRGMAKSG